MESPLEEAVAIGYSGLDICKSLDTKLLCVSASLALT
eukprot:COSAG04_NODE_118_length_25039_cov_11.342783_22_plen_37_part_00